MSEKYTITLTFHDKRNLLRVKDIDVLASSPIIAYENAKAILGCAYSKPVIIKRDVKQRLVIAKNKKEKKRG